jgi:hypothetical protein
VPLSLETAQTLALGHFNPHIITPEWLVKNKVCDDAEVELRFGPVLGPGLAFRFKEVQWLIDFQMLSVSSRKENCGDLVAKVVGRLPHTPVRAVGNNFNYACVKKDWGASPLPMIGDRRFGGLEEVGRVEQSRWACVIRNDDVRIEVTVAEVVEAETGMAVLFNFHRDTKSAKEAVKAAKCFAKDCRLSKDLLGRIIRQQVAK